VTLTFIDGEPLGRHTTLELGGPARHFIEARDDAAVVEALRWAAERGLPALVLGGGSNLVIADAGFDGLGLKLATRGVAFEEAGGDVRVRAAAGEPWDALVAATVERGLAGLECLSGIPGTVGATPIQNVGAYGQEVAETLVEVRVLDRRTLATEDWPAARCAFAYRDSVFKRAPDQHVVLAATFRLRRGGAPAVRYAELREALRAEPRPTLAQVREAVLGLRRRKSMVLDPADPNRRSVGSFFTNPIVSAEDAERIAAQAVRAGLVASAADVPRHPAGPGRVKLAAAWLIERAGIAKGLRRGAVGVSSRHTLALVHHGGGRTADLVALAREVRAAVQATFGVDLQAEPAFVGVRL
jgi:UDP-N-acetylmuramate dehydrogenase